jgi:hypothetical protein
MSTSTRIPECYRVRIGDHLDPGWSFWFDRLTIRQEDDGTTTLTGPLVDQVALYGLLARLRDHGATLLSVQRLPVDSPTADGEARRYPRRGMRTGDEGRRGSKKEGTNDA